MWTFTIREPHAPEVIGHRAVLDAVDVANVDGQVGRGDVDPLVELVEAAKVSMNIPGSGSKASGMPTRLGPLEHGRQGRGQPVHRLVLGDRVGEDARPERDALRLQFAGQVDGPAEEIDPDGPAGRVGVHQGRVVLVSRVEQVACTRLDDPGQPRPIEARSDLADLPGED